MFPLITWFLNLCNLYVLDFSQFGGCGKVARDIYHFCGFGGKSDSWVCCFFKMTFFSYSNLEYLGIYWWNIPAKLMGDVTDESHLC